MAKIKSIKFVNQDLNIQIETNIEYKSKSGYSRGYKKTGPERGNFFVKIPESYMELVGSEYAKTILESWYSQGKTFTAATGKDESEAEDNFRKYMNHYLSAKSKTDDVILYMFEYESENLDSSDSSFNHNWNEHGKVSIEFNYLICEKKKIADQVSYIKKERKGSRRDNLTDSVSTKAGSSNSWVEIPYTPEAEQFFEELYKGMETLCSKFKQYMGNRNAVLKTLEQKQKLLA